MVREKTWFQHMFLKYVEICIMFGTCLVMYYMYSLLFRGWQVVVVVVAVLSPWCLSTAFFFSEFSSHIFTGSRCIAGR